MKKELVQSLIDKLRERAHRLRIGAALTFALILLALAGGLFLFVYAGQISLRESASFDTLYRFNSDLSESLDRLDYLYVAFGQSDRPSLDSVERAALMSDIRDLKNAAESLPKQITDEETPPVQTVISTIVTRIGSVLLLVFLVQILVTLFKYNIRLAGYYDSRADALELLDDGNGPDLERIAAIFASESLDFGKAPPSPAQHAIDLAREIISSTKK
jgi:predicted PurR-regulated permease PerM